MKITLQQNKWYGDKPTEISLPDGWDVEYLAMPGDKEPVLTKEQVRERIEQPYGSEPLSQMARGKRESALFLMILHVPPPLRLWQRQFWIYCLTQVSERKILFLSVLLVPMEHIQENSL